jgi:hypothetical protein
MHERPYLIERVDGAVTLRITVGLQVLPVR